MKIIIFFLLISSAIYAMEKDIPLKKRKKYLELEYPTREKLFRSAKARKAAMVTVKKDSVIFRLALDNQKSDKKVKDLPQLDTSDESTENASIDETDEFRVEPPAAPLPRETEWGTIMWDGFAPQQKRSEVEVIPMPEHSPHATAQNDQQKAYQESAGEKFIWERGFIPTHIKHIKTNDTVIPGFVLRLRTLPFK